MAAVITKPIAHKANLGAGEYVPIYTVPLTSIDATVNARIVSHDLTKNIKTRMAIVQGAFAKGATPPPDTDWISPIDMIIGPSGIQSGTMEDTAIVMLPGETLVVHTDLGLATARVHGFERG